ncbi:NAD(+) diphosphatase [Glutamicibacter arilaitensis]|uniref:NAD(+) diphosphatase n=1 Tax=Glutamicibacter arilaitensis TaxID=256701 RepID=UPI00384AFFCC
MALAEKYRAPLTSLSFAQSVYERPVTEHDQPDLLPKVLADPQSRVMMLSELGAAINGESLLLIPGPDYRASEQEQFVYLGRDKQHLFVLAMVDAVALGEAEKFTWATLREAFNILDAAQAELFVEAQAIANWRRNEVFCPRCGSELRPSTSGWVQRCVSNGHELFPRTDPAVIAAIIDSEDRLLLGANSTFKSTMYSVLAGFVEAGESLESAVRREIFEESGVLVGDVAYRGSQPWPMPRSLMLGFTGEALSTQLVPDGAEILDLRWFTREQLRSELSAGTLEVPRSISIAHALIRSWYGEALPEAPSK